jgi:hypothetical protein
MGNIERRSGLSFKDFMNEYIIPNRPVILTDASKDWKAHGVFTPEFFKKNFADKKASIKGKEYQLGEYVDMMLASTPENPAPYPFKIDLERNFPELLAYVQPDFEVMRKNRLKSPLFRKGLIPQAATLEVFLGGAAGWFPYIHYDLYGLYAIVTQVYGHKEFILYKPEEEKYMYPDPENPWMSTIKNYHNPDYEKYPLFKNANPINDIVAPGETVYVPKGWWHTARSLEPTISIAKDLLVHQNWDLFSRDVVFYKRKQSKLKANVMSVFLKALGTSMSVHEKFVSSY